MNKERISHSLDDYTKQAMWIVHGKRCFYCREALLYRNIHIDHVISVKTYLRKENEIKEKYGLHDQFEFNTLDNYVPSCQSCNSARKREKEIPHGIPMWLHECHLKKINILETAQKIRRELCLDLPEQYQEFFITSPDFLLVGLEIDKVRKADIELYKNLTFHTDYWALKLISPDGKDEVQVHNLIQYQEWTSKDYFGFTTPDIAMSSLCDACITFFNYFENALYIDDKIPLNEYFQKLPASLLRNAGFHEDNIYHDDTTIKQYIKSKSNFVISMDGSNVILTYNDDNFNEGEIYIIKEILQADFTGTGKRQAILFIHYKSAGTFNYTFCVLATQKDNSWTMIEI